MGIAIFGIDGTRKKVFRTAFGRLQPADGAQGLDANEPLTFL